MTSPITLTIHAKEVGSTTEIKATPITGNLNGRRVINCQKYLKNLQEEIGDRIPTKLEQVASIARAVNDFCAGLLIFTMGLSGFIPSAFTSSVLMLAGATHMLSVVKDVMNTDFSGKADKTKLVILQNSDFIDWAEHNRILLTRVNINRCHDVYSNNPSDEKAYQRLLERYSL